MRLLAEELTTDHINRLITVSDDDGESITMTLTKLTPGVGVVIVRGRALGQSRGVVLRPDDVVHIFADEDDTAVARAVGVLHSHRPTIVTRGDLPLGAPRPVSRERLGLEPKGRA